MRCLFVGIGMLLLVCIFTGCAGTPEIIAHRGASYNAPENTLAAIDLAWEEKSDAAEFDVYITADEKVILHHDHTTQRITGENYVIQQTDSSVLRTLDVGIWKGSEFEGEIMPFLSEALDAIPRGKRAFIDVKSGPPIVEPMKNDIEASHLKRSQVVIIGFDHHTMEVAKRAMPDIEVYWLVGSQRDESGNFISHDPILLDIIDESGLDALNVHFGGVTPEFMELVKERGQSLYVWTVNNPDEAVRLAGLGVDGITTDKPAEIRAAIQEAYPWRSFFNRFRFR